MKSSSVIFLSLLVLVSLPTPAFGQVGVNVRFQHIDGREVSLSEYLHKGPVYMAFWALWCQPCIQELKALKALINENRDKQFTILAINQDSPRSVAKVRAFVSAQGYPFPVILDPNQRIFQSYNGQNLPFSVLLNRSGKIVSLRTGYLTGDEDEIAEEIFKLLE